VPIVDEKSVVQSALYFVCGKNYLFEIVVRSIINFFSVKLDTENIENLEKLPTLF
jgi:uncharacterized protein YqhQ